MARITVVNNNPEFLELVSDILESDRYEATTIDADRPEALDRIRASLPDLLMIDLRLGEEGSDGWDLARQLRSESDFAGLPILVCSGDLAVLDEIEPDVTDNRRVETLAKPFGIDELTAAIDRLLAEPVGG
jgi:CheY-like chemotaxis protein